jgi:hypothetical protein
LIDAVCDALASAEPPVFGWEPNDTCPSHHRTVIQFRVDPNLFDWFFNARTGYRAHFRAHPDRGLAFNGDVIRALRDRLWPRLPSSVDIRRVDTAMNDLEAISLPSADLVRSLDPELAKVWFGATPIGGGYRPTGLSGPKIRVGSASWAAPYMDDAWLDLKGAFDGNSQLYQPKSPRERANKLHETGRA